MMKILAVARLVATTPKVVSTAIEDLKLDLADYEKLMAEAPSKARKQVWATRIYHLKIRLQDWQHPET
jgi:hypothetical protein